VAVFYLLPNSPLTIPLGQKNTELLYPPHLFLYLTTVFPAHWNRTARPFPRRFLFQTGDSKKQRSGHQFNTLKIKILDTHGRCCQQSPGRWRKIGWHIKQGCATSCFSNQGKS